MGTIYEKQGLYDQAKKHFLRALELDKNFVLAKINIATLYQLEGNIEKANQIYNDIVKESNQMNPQVLYRQKCICLKLGKL